MRPNIVWFLFFAIFLAYLSPRIGSHRVVGQVAGVGFFAIFFCYGIRMSLLELWRGLANWRLHILVQLSTFLIFPVVVLAVCLFFLPEFVLSGSAGSIWLGIFYISVLPSTVSSSIVMVSIGGGNVPAAIFNASISGIIGVFVTPIWMSFFISGVVGFGEFSVFGVIFDLFIIIILPLILGMCFNRRFGDWFAKNKNYLKYFDQSVILLVVYNSFAQSFSDRAFDGFTVMQLAFLCVGMALLFFCVYGITLICCKVMRFKDADTITALFCGSKKSLVHGVTMSKVIFADISGVGVLLLPLMIYHAVQLIIANLIAKHFAEKKR
jgi:sodium/bile acid cotransporter 7